MTAPALILLADDVRSDADVVTLQRIQRRLAAVRSNWHCQIAVAGHDVGSSSLLGALRRIKQQGLQEAVCVPLDTAHLTAPSGTLVRAVAAANAAQREVECTVADGIGAPGGLFSLLDRRLREALSRQQSREIDALMLLHDGTGDETDLAVLARRARAWGAHHRLPVACAGLSSGSGATAALAGHTANGRRHVAVGWLSVLDAPEVRSALTNDGYVAAVSAPLDADDAVLDAVIAAYSVAALRALDVGADVA